MMFPIAGPVSLKICTVLRFLVLDHLIMAKARDGGTHLYLKLNEDLDGFLKERVFHMEGGGGWADAINQSPM